MLAGNTPRSASMSCVFEDLSTRRHIEAHVRLTPDSCMIITKKIDLKSFSNVVKPKTEK